MTDRLPKILRTRGAVERGRDTVAVRCKCAHPRSAHWPDRRLCLGSSVCGCAEYREDDGNRWPPARFRNDYDPSEPIERQTR